MALRSWLLGLSFVVFYTVPSWAAQDYVQYATHFFFEGYEVQMVVSVKQKSYHDIKLVEFGVRSRPIGSSRSWIPVFFEDPSLISRTENGNQVFQLSFSNRSARFQFILDPSRKVVDGFETAVFIANHYDLNSIALHIWEHSSHVDLGRLDSVILRASWGLLTNVWSEQKPKQAREMPPPMPTHLARPIWRWRGIVRANGQRPIHVQATVFDPEGDAVLIEFAQNSVFQSHPQGLPHDFSRSMKDVESFRIETVNGIREFILNVRPPKGLERKPVTFDESLIPSFSARHVRLLADGKILIANLKVPNSVHFQNTLQSDRMFFYNGVPNDRLVLEPNTISPITYDDYFLPKGIHLPPSRDASAGWTETPWLSQYPKPIEERPQQSLVTQILAPNDLNLVGRLKGREAEVWDLLQQPEKPTMEQFINLVGDPAKGDRQNPFSSYFNKRWLSIEIKSNIPELISRFEKAFPRARWYGLGRDIFLLSDILDAFYIYRGQPKRVVRLGASQGSFDENNIDETIEFLHSNGFDFASISAQSDPQIIFDITSYRRTNERFSQSAQLMRAAYTAWARLGRSTTDLVRKVNFVSTDPRIHPNTVQLRLYDDPSIIYFSNVVSSVDGPDRIIAIGNSRDLQYTEAWHEVYGRFQSNAQTGAVAAPPGPLKPVEIRLRLLGEMWEIAATVMTDEFVRSVKQVGGCQDLLDSSGRSAPN